MFDLQPTANRNADAHDGGAWRRIGREWSSAMKKMITLLAVLGMVLALAPAAQAAVTAVDSITTNGSINIDTITVGGTTYDTSSMVTGVSVGAGDGAVTDMDNFNLNSQFSPSGNWDTEFAGENLTGAEFFVFEAGGNDALWVKPIFENDTTGNSLTLSTGSGSIWGATGVRMTGGARSNQFAYGLTFSYTNLLNGSGANLTTEVIKGLEFNGSDGVDAASISAWLVQEIDITGNGNSITNGDPNPSLLDHTDFASTIVGGVNITNTYTVTNSGSADLTLSNLNVTAGQQFSVGPLGSATVSAGGATPFDVTYTPSGAAAVHNATVSLDNNDPNESPYTFAITAETTATPEPEIDITGNSVSIFDGDDSPSTGDHTDFGSTNVFGPTIVRTYTVENSGTADLTLTSSATVSGAGAAQFAVGALTATTLANSETATFTVTYTPSVRAAVHNAMVSLANNDSDENPYNFDITAETTPALVIYVFEDTVNDKIDFAWNGIIGASGTGTTSTRTPSADQIVPNSGNFQVGDRTTNDQTTKWTASEYYAGTVSLYGSGGPFSDFLTTQDIPFFVKGSDGTLHVGYTDQANTNGIPDLSSQTFAGSFSLTNNLAHYGLFTTGYELPLTLWTADSGDGAIVFAPGTPPGPAGAVFIVR